MPIVRRALRFPVLLKRAFGQMLAHDGLNLAQSAAYSAIVALFPAMIVAAATLASLPDVNALKMSAAEFFNQVLPETVLPLLNSYFVNSGPSAQDHSIRALVVAAVVSLVGASSVISTLIEGLQRAAGVPVGTWNFMTKRVRSLMLVPLSLLPLAVASVLVVFGRLITEWVAMHMMASARPAFFAMALVVRWTISLAGVAGLTALIYHLGVPGAYADGVRKRWAATLPGAVVATGMWFVATLVFGWYVTRVANYSAVYGSLGVGIALLIWLYLVFVSVLCGAEYNEQMVRRW